MSIGHLLTNTLLFTVMCQIANPLTHQLLYLFLFFFLRKVRKAEGLRLSSEFETLFDEVSAADGRNVEANLWQMAKLLREKQDRDIQKAMAVSLHNTHKRIKQKKKKNLCC